MAESAPTPHRPLRVFVVEDNEDTRDMLSRLLVVMGHEVRGAASMHEALHKLPEADPDVIISDIGLPDGDGHDLLRLARLERPVYAIAMSGYGTAADRERSAAVGFRHHLVKPMDIVRLEGMLAEAARECEALRH
jgi:CheY-like chemotaxis protein